MPLTVTLLIQLLEDLLRQNLAQLNTPLIKAVDIPDGTLGEGEVFVVDNQRTQLGGANGASHQDGSRGSVTQESLMRDELLGGALGPDLLVGLSYHESLGLSEVVGGKHLLLQVVGNWVVRLSSQDEVGRDKLGALVNKLEERVLSIGAGLAEDDGPLYLNLVLEKKILLEWLETYQWCTWPKIHQK